MADEEVSLEDTAAVNVGGEEVMEMKVLVLGLCRTGTQSLATALEILGYGPVYHMKEVSKNNHAELWVEALEAKFEGKGKWPWSRREWDRLLHGYAGVSDIPACLFAKELIDAYPEAKVILSTRPEDEWVKSMMATIWHAYTHHPPMPSTVSSSTSSSLTSTSKPTPMLTLAQKYHTTLWQNDFPSHGRERYKAHNEEVKSLMRDKYKGEGSEAMKEKFLEYRPGEGWAPLVEFLGLEAQGKGELVDGKWGGMEFPRCDDWGEYKRVNACV